MAECETEKKYFNRDGKEVKRQSCTIFCRVMGYLSPARTVVGGSQYNIGKRSEFYSRKWFDIEVANKSPYVDHSKYKTDNQTFVEKYEKVLS